LPARIPLSLQVHSRWNRWNKAHSYWVKTMTDSSMNILDAQKYAQIEIDKGAVAALTQLTHDIGVRAPQIHEMGDGFSACVPEIDIRERGLTRSFVSFFGTSKEAAAAALLKELLNPEPLANAGEPWLQHDSIRFRIKRAIQPVAPIT
jgi:hypothetical protein